MRVFLKDGVLPSTIQLPAQEKPSAEKPKVPHEMPVSRPSLERKNG